MVLAPEHPLVDTITTLEFKPEVEKYKSSTKSMSEIDRTSTVKEKTGVFTALIPLTRQMIKKFPYGLQIMY